MATDMARREPYIGEKRNFLRNGYGVYVYENQFFRYEGEWQTGKKHGHGKLQMKDGTYYEGQFVNGEINGHGFKFFNNSKCKYTGQFLNGEMHGHGVMQYADQSIYEGQWHKNKKQGFGILRTSSTQVYEGAFSLHHKNGEGCQTYDNGDRYEGYWVMDKRHGQGELFCADGSYYCGQFEQDLYHGDGKMQHASGMLYAGQWLHGFPSRLATKMVLIVEEAPLLIRQGLPFKVAVKCLDDDGNDLDEDMGREIQVTAGFRHIAPKQGSVLFDMIEDVEEKPIPTPFGYEVVSYPLTDQLSEEEAPAEDEKGEKAGKDEDGEDRAEGEGEGGEVAEGEGEEEGVKEATMLSTEDGTAADLNAAPADAPPAGSNPPSPSQEPTAMETEREGNPVTQRTVTPVEATPLPPPVSTKRTDGGYVEWSNLQLSPPPPLYRPFVALDEDKKNSKKSSIKDKFKQAAVERALLELEKPQKRPSSSSSKKKLKKDGGMMKTKTNVAIRPILELKVEDEEDRESENEEKRASTLKLGDKDKGGLQPAVADEKFARIVIVEDEWEAMKGEYVLMVHDVTSPPFLGTRLEPLFLLLKLKKPKKIIVKKPKWNTAGHIAAAMHARHAEN